MLTLLGVLVIVLGFALRFNPLLVVIAAALTSGLAAGLTPLEVLAAFGKAFNTNRYVSVVWLVLPAIGLLERAGLQQRARNAIRGIRAASAGRILLVYLLMRQLTAALGLVSVAGQAQTVRPLVAPMAEAAAEPLDDDQRETVKAMTAATDNVGLFFGEDIFLAIGSILLIVGFLDQSGVTVEPLRLSMWAIPSAIAAFVIHGARLLLFDRRLKA
ncbi:DUF969 domain-containing protein [Caulobacter sp. RL271]|jgi:uncharacterized membrane protein|uniref:DUF969 domain-containing protein n=1 Tax=Caulobacter segnis TaxID=88688 RepID=A0ABY4ZMP0_9CAUL|nr:DUF969 domain-containing protein [Caulobacter segnis]USQ94072.1 DUF969 domain-containing protein [Caulobacter segnis]